MNYCDFSFSKPANPPTPQSLIIISTGKTEFADYFRPNVAREGRGGVARMSVMWVVLVVGVLMLVCVIGLVSFLLCGPGDSADTW